RRTRDSAGRARPSVASLRAPRPRCGPADRRQRNRPVAGAGDRDAAPGDGDDRGDGGGRDAGGGRAAGGTDGRTGGQADGRTGAQAHGRTGARPYGGGYGGGMRILIIEDNRNLVLGL